VAASLLCGGTAAFGATAALHISGKPPVSSTAGGAYVFRPSVSGLPAGRTLKFSIVHKPVWAQFNGSTGALWGVPNSVGTFSDIVISVSDGISAAALPAFAVKVSADPVRISGRPAQSVTAGARYSFRPAASDSAGHALSYSVWHKPAWASFSIATGELSGTPKSSQTGTYAGIVISASDGKARAWLAPFTIRVSAAKTALTPSANALSANVSAVNALMLAEKHPGDVGLESDPAVVHYENFAQPSVAAVVARYESYVNAAGMALVADHPANSPSTRAMRFTAGGKHPATDLYKSFGAGYDELYFRYYIKYEGSGPWHHSGLWFGGYNPPLPWPDPHAGERPLGNDRYSIGLEPISTFAHTPMDFYVYWRGMHSWMAEPSGKDAYYGNTLLNDAQFLPQSDTWVCYEIHLKLNPDPADGSGAVLELWKDNELVRTFDESGPFGFWVRDKFCPTGADDSACTVYRPKNPDWVRLDQRWRTTAALKINYFWPQNYNTSSANSSLLLADMVVARQRVGCTVRK